MALFRNDQQTICALATPPGVGGIGVIRVSGADAASIVSKLAPFLPSSLESHRIYYGHIQSLPTAEQQAIELDEVLLSYFSLGRSFTGEQTIEISFHGSPLIGTRILQELVIAGCRVADPGEFTYRAFMNGRIDLVQAESVLNLIESQSETSRKMALRQLKGSLSHSLAEIEQELVGCLAHMEANLDFAQEDIEIASSADLVARLKVIGNRLDDLVSTYRAGRIATTGFQVAILGSPNVGKSSLLNAVAKEDKAIVTDVPGTTRDLVSADINLGHHFVRFFDTAGLRETEDIVEKIGIERSLGIAKETDLVLFLDEVGRPESLPAHLLGKNVLRVSNKLDLASQHNKNPDIYYISAMTGEGIPELLQAISAQVQKLGADSGSVILGSRQFKLLSQARDAVATGMQLTADGASSEFGISEVQLALENVLEVLGKRFDDEVMDQVFRQFCLGK